MARDKGNDRFNNGDDDLKEAQINGGIDDSGREADDDQGENATDDLNGDDSSDDSALDSSDSPSDNGDAGSAFKTAGSNGRGEHRHGRRESDRRDAITGRSDHSDGDSDTTGYQFDVDGDVVSNLRRVQRGVSRAETIEKGEEWSFDGVNLIQSEVTRLGTEVTTYGDSDGDSIFTRIRESFSPFTSGGAPLF